MHAETREREDVYIDSQADYLLYEALDQVEQPIDTQLPEFPTCPVPDLVTGAGGYCRGHSYYKLVFPQALTDCKFCIAALEAFNLLVALRLWAKEWQGLKIVVYTDNYASVCAAASGAAQDPLIQGVYRETWWLCALNDIYMTILHRPGAQMEAADLLSRVDTNGAFSARLQTFREQFTEQERPVSNGLLHPPLPI